MRRIKSIISLVLALILACAAALPISAAGPLAGDSLYINTHIDAINSATGKNYLSDTGDTMDFLKLKAYDQNPVYCIEKGARFTRTLYKAQTLANSAYWKKLTEKAREGIALAAAFGYPAQSYSVLGVPSADDAYTATQFIIWEYQQGLRTAPDEQIADRRYRAKIAGTPAETAYKNILSNIRKYISDPQYSGNTQNLYGFVQLTSGSTSKEQEIICFYGETPKLLEKGYIEVYKKDTDGNLLDGAEFSVYNSSGAYVTKIGPTVNGYARSAEITFGTYKVVETKFPQNYRKYGNDSWTVTLNSGGAKFTINAVNEIVPGACRIIKASEDGVIAGVSFRITGNGTDETAKTNENGEIIFSSLKPGRYTVTEDTEDKYIPQESKAVTVVTGETAVVTFSNVLKKGSLKVVKTAEDGFKENFTFRLTGTSYSGLPVNEYAVTNNDGEAVFENVLIGSGYILEEINTPARYVVPEAQTALIEWNKVTDISVSNTLKKWRADVCKYDGELNKEGASQGNASLKGAVYGLYKDGQLTATYTTDENGRFVTDYVKETPYIEKLIKAGFTELAEELLNGKSFNIRHRIDSGGSSLKKILCIDSVRLKELKETNGGFKYLSWLQYEKGQNVFLSRCLKKWFIGHNLMPNDLSFISDRMSAVQIFNYINKQINALNMTCNEVMDLWKDYLAMAVKLNMDTNDAIIYRVGRLRQRHAELVNLLQRKDLHERANEIIKSYPLLPDVFSYVKAKYEYAGETFSVIAPSCVEDVLAEGRNLHHCVAEQDRYLDRIERRESYILFLRRTNEPDVSYYTLEVEPGGTIRQKRTLYDRNDEDIITAEPFLREWQKVIKKRLSEEDKSLAETSKVLRLEEFAELDENNILIHGGELRGIRLVDVLMKDLLEAA